MVKIIMSSRLEGVTRQHDEKLRQILKVAARIFAEKGFHRTSVRDISRATRMSLAGLYYYFTTKEELLYLIQARCFETLLQRWESAAASSLDVRARIRIFAENHLSFFLHNMHEMKVMAHEDESLTGEFQERVLVLKRRYVKVLMDLIAELQKRQGEKTLDLRVATFALFGMMNWIYTWYQPKRDLPFPQLIEQMLRVYFFGILNGDKVDAPWFTAAAVGAGKEAFSLWRPLT
ncbi:MAG TPA: TetR/AcrR family transcriptional regulator [candidate division Zixibacteria bacterium]|nr:TetR/AcrR family transcriptional regulator [candidate division Zixibacteria bacterium]